MNIRWLAAVAVAAAWPVAAGAAVIEVPNDQPTIQAAIDAANTGDEIVVAAGTYPETIDLLGKAVTLRSAGGPELTTIDGGGSAGPVVRCAGGEGPDTVVEGFTITGGHAALGGGLLCDGASPTITGCRIAGNDAARGGGAAMVNGAAPTLAGCRFDGNQISPGTDCFEAHAAPGCGNAICESIVCDAAPLCCDVLWDQACADQALELCFDLVAANGGGIYSENAAPVLTDCLISGNIAEFTNPLISKPIGSGGGVYVSGGAVTLVRCTISGNSASSGGGLSISGSPTRLVACRVLDNSALGSAGLFGSASDVLVAGCLFSGNFAGFGSDGAMSFFGGNPRVACCTVADNGAAVEIGGIGSYFGAALVLDDCIVYDNMGLQLGGLAPVVRYSCIQGGHPGPGNIDADPAFVDPANGDYRLQLGSPCADAGHNWGIPDDVADLDADGDTIELLPLDLDGEPRIQADPLDFDPGCGLPAIVDMGALEYPGGPAGPIRRGDVNGDGMVGIDDLVAVVLGFGECPPGCCLADLDLSGSVDIDDIVTVVLNWG